MILVIIISICLCIGSIWRDCRGNLKGNKKGIRSSRSSSEHRNHLTLNDSVYLCCDFINLFALTRCVFWIALSIQKIFHSLVCWLELIFFLSMYTYCACMSFRFYKYFSCFFFSFSLSFISSSYLTVTYRFSSSISFSLSANSSDCLTTASLISKSYYFSFWIS